jgi:replication fork protection complex subunit Tof1/Swi1
VVSSNDKFWKSSAQVIISNQEELVQRMQEEEMIDLLLSLAASSGDLEYRPFNCLLLEIFHLIFYGRPVENISETVQKSTLEGLLQKEKLKKKRSGTRHPRFGGTYSMETTNGSKINVRKAPIDNSFDFDSGKKPETVHFKKFQKELYTERPLVLTSSPKIFRSIAKSFMENCLNGI